MKVKGYVRKQKGRKVYVSPYNRGKSYEEKENTINYGVSHVYPIGADVRVLSRFGVRAKITNIFFLKRKYEVYFTDPKIDGGYAVVDFTDVKKIN